MKRIDWQWWARTTCVIVAIWTWFAVVPNPHTWPGWIAYDAAALAAGMAAAAIYESAMWTYRHYRTR